ncbi:MAG: hypothetical protein BroJett021_11540 [Chloroflexota bacterium]|nr:MAG: hypothetical protein BroJett021_11540 [Chloroflexota bacterium]
MGTSKNAKSVAAYGALSVMSGDATFLLSLSRRCDEISVVLSGKWDYILRRLTDDAYKSAPNGAWTNCQLGARMV